MKGLCLQGCLSLLFGEVLAIQKLLKHLSRQEEEKEGLRHVLIAVT